MDKLIKVLENVRIETLWGRGYRRGPKDVGKVACADQRGGGRGRFFDGGGTSHSFDGEGASIDRPKLFKTRGSESVVLEVEFEGKLENHRASILVVLGKVG